MPRPRQKPDICIAALRSGKGGVRYGRRKLDEWETWQQQAQETVEAVAGTRKGYYSLGNGRTRIQTDEEDAVYETYVAGEQEGRLVIDVAALPGQAAWTQAEVLRMIADRHGFHLVPSEKTPKQLDGFERVILECGLEDQRYFLTEILPNEATLFALGQNMIQARPKPITLTQEPERRKIIPYATIDRQGTIRRTSETYLPDDYLMGVVLQGNALDRLGLRVMTS